MKKVIIVFILINLCAVFVSAEYQTPAWRGQASATYQKWLFDDFNNPANPDEVNNPFGTPSASITPGFLSGLWLEDILGGLQYGYWDLGGDGGLIEVVVPDDSSNDREIWLQMVYYEHLQQKPGVNIPDAEFVSSEIFTIEDGSFGKWMLEKTVWNIEAGVILQPISISTDPLFGSIVESISVDVLSIQEIKIVDYDDLEQLMAQWLNEGPGLDADLYSDNKIDFRDFSVLASLWLQQAPEGWPW